MTSTSPESANDRLGTAKVAKAAEAPLTIKALRESNARKDTEDFTVTGAGRNPYALETMMATRREDSCMVGNLLTRKAEMETKLTQT